MTQRETHGVSFTNCPECGVNFGSRGMARHRKTAHGVEPASKAKKGRNSGASKLSLEERLARINAGLV